MSYLQKLASERGAPASFIAEKTGINPMTVRRHLRGETSPNAEMMLKYAEFFGVDVGVFISMFLKRDQDEPES